MKKVIFDIATLAGWHARSRGFAVFFGKECCACFFKVLIIFIFLYSWPAYAADKNHYAAAFRYKLS